MKTYEGKTLSEALNKAAVELNVPVSQIKPKAKIISQKKTLFTSSVVIGIFNNRDVFEYAVSYLSNLLDFIGASGTFQRQFNKETFVINIQIDSEDGSKIIGKNGETLKALNTLVRSACFNKYGGKYKILLNCGNYKEQKYEKLEILTRKIAYDVQKSGVPASLRPMPADERRVVHNTLLEFPDLESPSVDTGKNRHIIIRKKSK